MSRKEGEMDGYDAQVRRFLRAEKARMRAALQTAPSGAAQVWCVRRYGIISRLHQMWLNGKEGEHEQKATN